ncbi:MAG: alpha-2-macroglobulin, partial [Planctomycetes bacterium]|nr:alpha-2-macroglobulin [Planctomycetota bacterium]
MNTTTTRSLLTVIFLLSASLPLEAKSQRTEGYAALKEQAERFYAEDSYALAHQVYAQAQTAGVPESEKRWVAFRLADTQWRSQVATNNPDTTIEEQARTELESIIAAVKREEDRDHIWVEAHESLGDYFWTRPRSQNWGRAWPHYQLALDHWPGSGDLDLARDRYLAIVWDMSMPPWQNIEYYYGSSYVPRDILENALKISVSKPDRARASFLLEMTYRSYGD